MERLNHWDRIIVEIVPGQYVRNQALHKMFAPG